jgi:hypothetical protein
VKTILSYVVILAALVAGLVLTKKYRLLGFAALIALVGSDTDSAGPMYGIISFFPQYKIVTRSLVLIIFGYSVIKLILRWLNNKIDRKIIYWYFYPLLGSTILIFVIDTLRGNSLVVTLSEIIWLGLPFFFIWLQGSDRSDSREALIHLVFLQAIVTIVVLVAGPATAGINGASYAYIINAPLKDIAQTIVNSRISFANLSKSSLSVFKFAQYHNPNALGVYATVMIATAIYIAMRSKFSVKQLILSACMLVIGVIAWFNSLTRGPIIMIILVLGIFFAGIIIKPKTLPRISFFFFIILASLLVSDKILDLIQYFLVTSSNISFTSRLSGFAYGFEAIIKNPLIGVMPSPQDPIPHILSLKIAAYYGFPAAILFTVPFIHLAFNNIKIFIKDIASGNAERSLWPTMLSGIVFGTMLTNGVVVYVLFWIIFAEAAKYFIVERKEPVSYHEEFVVQPVEFQENGKM